MKQLSAQYSHPLTCLRFVSCTAISARWLAILVTQILELCEARLKSLKSSIDKDFDESRGTSRRRTFKQISNTFGGAGPAVVAFFLETVYKLQILSGVKPGVEFSEPIRRSSSWKLVCGDAPARDTVRELYNVFKKPLRSLRDSLSSIDDLIGRVIFPPDGGVNMPRIFLTEPRRLRELARLTLPALLISGAVSLAGNAGALALESAPAMSILNEGYPASLLQLLLSVGQTLVVSYVIVSTLHFMKVLIADRDRILTRSILETASELQATRRTPVVVCAVVGLLHVNGIVRQIQEQDTVGS